MAESAAGNNSAETDGRRLLMDVRGCMTSVLSQKHFKIASDRCAELQDFGTRLLSVCTEDNIAALHFAKTLQAEMNKILETSGTYKVHATKRGKAWSMFHSFRCGKLVEMWKELLTKLDVTGINVLFVQSVTQELFEARLKVQFYHVHEPSEVMAEDISEDEKNILMYACGYVPASLIRRYEKRNGTKYASFVQCLQQMAVGVFEDSFYEYAKRWFESINRGGAFELGDSGYNFFLIVERKLRTYLKALYEAKCDPRSKVINDLIKDEDILFYWSMVHVDLSEEEALELLNDILNLWLTVRGFSVTGTWNEQYKKLSNETTKAKSGLRKGLKRSSEKKEKDECDKKKPKSGKEKKDKMSAAKEKSKAANKKPTRKTKQKALQVRS